ncbi:hypothetical protein [Arthrobacter sp. B1I2]|uniref:hypothetical protein n=1 Tax=Arthrobacter sp. B1I2 TaxID=3042263 RepID=UPI00277E3EB2|nr:hypothetical protein [Arthrobacter sp. B1I2]MDQ0729925.1 hypothetical protein [Arthrobacter sp. B1I2]
MRIWKKYVVPRIAAITVVLLGGAGASGADEMANARITHPAAVTTVAAHTGQLSLRHLVLLGLAKGSLPGRTTICRKRRAKRATRKPRYGWTVPPAEAAARELSGVPA